MLYRLALSRSRDHLDEIKPIGVKNSLILAGQLILANPNKNKWSWINDLWLTFTGNLEGIVFYYYFYQLLTQLPLTQQWTLQQYLQQKFHKVTLMLFHNTIYVGWKKESFLLSTKSVESTFCLILDDRHQIIEVRSYEQFIETIHQITLFGPDILSF